MAGRSRRPRRLAMLLAGLLGPPLLAADSTPQGQAKPPVVSVSLGLVQVDAVVTDAQGRHIDDLGCEEFEIYEDRRKQPITNCSFVRTPDSPIPAPGAPERMAPGTQPIRREDVRRTIALLVDDLDLDLQSVVAVRKALEAFVQNQTAPGDLVSMIRTSGGAGALQQFTTDRRVLGAAIERIRFNPQASPDVFEPLGAVPVLGGATGNNRPVAKPQGFGNRELDRLYADTLAGGTVGTLRFVLMGLRELPGRKSVVMFSKGHAMFADGSLTAFGRAVPALVELANRASVVIYTVDTVGVVSGQLTAADNVNPAGAGASAAAFQSGLNTFGRAGIGRFRSGLDGLSALSDPTGGLLMRGENDLSRQLAKVLEDQNGYYLIGYAPAASTFSAGARPAFHKIEVKVRRKGLRVRSRKGFFGMTDEDPRIAKPSGGASLAASLTSPFSASDVDVRLSSVFLQDAQRTLLHSFLHVNTKALTLAANPDGTFTTRADIAALTFDADGQLVDQLSRIGELRLTQEARDLASRYGVSYIIDVPVKKAGAYQLRVAFRDTASGRTGSAYQFVEVPDLTNGRLALSGVLMTDGVLEGTYAVPDDAPLQSEGARAVATAARRAFAPDHPIAYGLTVYNARLGPSAGQARLQMQVKVFLDGKEVITGEVRDVETKGQDDPKALFAGGILVLPRQMVSGEYQLLVTVVDALAPADLRMAVQATSFEVAGKQAAQDN